MTVNVNGEPRELPEGASVAVLLEQLEIGARGVAVELNREIVPRQRFAEQMLHEGDAVEIVTLVGGG